MKNINETNNLKTITDWVRYIVSELNNNSDEIFYGHGSIDSFSEAHALVMGVLNLPFDWPVEYFSARLTNSECESLKSAIKKRIVDKIPTAYITNRAHYMGLDFYVDERVLIPRSPIFEIIESGFSPYFIGKTSPKILDLCCGSGCIGIAASYIFDDAEITLSDISESALEVSSINLEKHSLSDAILLKSDLFDSFDSVKFDIIVSNPPYVDKETMNHLPDEFRHEPKLALVSGNDGLDCARNILKNAANHLEDNGILILEVGASFDILEESFPSVTFNWHTFNKGGDGVLVFTKNELIRYKDEFV